MPTTLSGLMADQFAIWICRKRAARVPATRSQHSESVCFGPNRIGSDRLFGGDSARKSLQAPPLASCCAHQVLGSCCVGRFAALSLSLSGRAQSSCTVAFACSLACSHISVVRSTRCRRRRRCCCSFNVPQPRVARPQRASERTSERMTRAASQFAHSARASLTPLSAPSAAGRPPAAGWRIARAQIALRESFLLSLRVAAKVQ